MDIDAKKRFSYGLELLEKGAIEEALPVLLELKEDPSSHASIFLAASLLWEKLGEEEKAHTLFLLSEKLETEGDGEVRVRLSSKEREAFKEFSK